MAAQDPLPFWSQSGKGRSSIITAERIENWYLRQNPPQSLFPFSLFPTPGLVLEATCGNGPIRGLRRMRDILYVVSGTKVYSVNEASAVTELGDIPGVGDCYMTDNGTHVLIVPTAGHDTSYAVNESEIVPVAEVNLLGAAYQDGYGIAGKRGSEQFNISDVDDMTTWQATEFSSADTFADYLVAIASVHRLLWMMGENTVERWYNSGNSDFPFERQQGSIIEIGCKAGLSVAVADDDVLWLDNNLQVRRSVAGSKPVIISTDAIGKEIEDSASPQSAVGWVYTQDHQIFYVLELGNDATVVYNLNTGLWHHRKSTGIDRWRAHLHQSIWNRQIVGDYTNGNIYRLDLDTYTENGATIRRVADSAPLHANGNRALMHELLVVMEPGVGLDGAVQGSNPELMVSFSDNDGKTYGNDYQIGIGKIGEYDRAVQLVALGGFRRRTVRIAISDPVKAVVAAAYHRTEGLAA